MIYGYESLAVCCLLDDGVGGRKIESGTYVIRILRKNYCLTKYYFKP